MKYFIFLSFILCSNFPLFAQSTTATTTTAATTTNTAITDETALNQKLLDNAAASQKILDSTKKTPTPTKFNILGGGVSSQKSTTNLTDQEKQLSENYVDQAAANRIIKEKCVGEMVQGCRGDEVDHKILGMNPAMVKVATQAYATFSAVTDFLPVSNGSKGDKPADKTTGTVPDAKPEGETTAAKKGKEKAEDYCKYIPAGTETVAKFTEQANVQALDQQINNGGGTSQKESLLKAAKNHDSRATQAQIQAVGWYGGAACYAYQASTGTFAVDTALMVKLGSSALLGTFYQAEVAANKEYARKTREIADSIPGKGVCNPITENDCYCAEPEHANDPVNCQAQIAAKAGGSAFTKVACTDSNLKIDPTCACDKTNTCFDKFLQNQGAVELNLGIGNLNSPFKPIASLAHGKLEGGTLNSQAFAGTSAIAKKALSELANKIPASNSPLTLSQKELVDAMVAKGIPANVARLMAQNPPSQSAMDSAKSKMAGLGSGYEMANYASGNSSVLDFSGGNGLGTGGIQRGEKKSGVDDFLGKLNPKTQASNAKILEFAQKAEKNASQITKSDRLIFDIISMRYQTSGRRLLQVEPGN